MSRVETWKEPAEGSWQREEWSGAEDGRGRAGRGRGLARALGWFSLGLGLAELAAPRRVSRAIGLRDGRSLVLQALGAREIASGLGILSGRGTPRWVWARVAGDLVDLALLGVALGGGRRSERGRVAAATAAVAGVAALDVVAARRVSRNGGRETSGEAHVQETIAVNCDPAQAYALWRDLASLPRFMEHLESVEVLGERRSRWVAKAPAGQHVEWEAELVEDRPGEAIAWRSVEGSDVGSRGAVRFERAPGGRGTLVRVEMEYRPPAGSVGRAVARLFGEEPEQQVRADLRRFKQVLETGEVPTTEGQPAGPRSPLGGALARWRE